MDPRVPPREFNPPALPAQRLLRLLRLFNQLHPHPDQGLLLLWRLLLQAARWNTQSISCPNLPQCALSGFTIRSEAGYMLQQRQKDPKEPPLTHSATD